MILLTGANGFIGQHISKYLAESQERHFEFKRSAYGDLSCPITVEKYFKERPTIDTILHFAANAKPKLGSNPSSMIDDNIKATMNLAEYCHPNTKFIFASSLTVYGDIDKCCTTEEYPCNPIAVYSSTKLCSENILNYYKNNGKIQVSHLRMPAVVGSGLTHGALKDIIRKVKENDELELFGNKPGASKTYLYIKDLIKVIDIMLQKDFVKYGTYNICPKGVVSIEEMAEIVMHELNIFKPIKWLGESSTWVGDNNLLCADNIKARHYLRWLPITPEEAIRQTVRDIENANP